MIQFDVREPDKRRFLDAVNHVDSDQVPFHEQEFHPKIVSAVLGEEYTCRSYLMPMDATIRFARCVGLDLCRLSVSWYLGREKYIDEDGMERYKAAGNIRSRDDWDKINAIDVDGVRRRIEDALRHLEGTGIGWTIGLPTAASVIVSAMGFNHYFLSVYDDADFLLEFIARAEERIFPVTELILEYEPDAIGLALFLCDKNGLMMSAELTERFVFEPVERHMRLLRPSGIPIECHSDGTNTPVMDRLADLGFAIFHPNEVNEKFDIYESKERWGDRIALAGGVDVWETLNQGTPERVREDTLERLERLSRGGGYICGSSHDIGEDTPLANLRAMAETVASYRTRGRE